MTSLFKAVGVWLGGTAMGAAGVTGIWLLSQSTNPFMRTVGGATLVVSALWGMLIALWAWDEV